jgi:hypothetical protein
MDPDGSYEQVQADGDEPIRDTQSILMQQTRRATDGTTNRGVAIDDQFIDEDLLVDLSSEADNDTHPVRGDDSPDVLDAHSEHWYSLTATSTPTLSERPRATVDTSKPKKVLSSCSNGSTTNSL